MRAAVLVVLAVLAVIEWPTEATDVANRLDPPSGSHLLGTDQLGRDVLARVLGGIRWTVGLGVGAAVVSLVLGIAVGLGTGWLDGTRARVVATLVQSVVDLVVALPSLLVGLLVAAVLGPGLVPAVIALVVLGWAPFARLAHRLTVAARAEGWVLAARSLGAGPGRILRSHVLPAIAGPVREAFTARVLGAMLTLAGLSFLGLGVQPPTPEWGAMLAEGRTAVFSAPWLVVGPAAALVLVSLGLGPRATKHGVIRTQPSGNTPLPGSPVCPSSPSSTPTATSASSPPSRSTAARRSTPTSARARRWRSSARTWTRRGPSSPS